MVSGRLGLRGILIPSSRRAPSPRTGSHPSKEGCFLALDGMKLFWDQYTTSEEDRAQITASHSAQWRHSWRSSRRRRSPEGSSLKSPHPMDAVRDPKRGPRPRLPHVTEWRSRDSAQP